MRVGLVVPHIFMQAEILPHVIFSPGALALELATGLQACGDEVTLYTPGPVTTTALNKTVDLSAFKQELAARDLGYLELLKQKPLTFITLARHAQAELISQAYTDANNNLLDVVHIYTNEEDIALPFAQFCNKPVVFTHHDPYNLTANYKNVFPRYSGLNWLSISLNQRLAMPEDTNWVGNVYHGLDEKRFQANLQPSGGYLAYMGRIISPKGVHLAIKAVKTYNYLHNVSLKLKIAGKHYAEASKDNYWAKQIEPEQNELIEYVGFIRDDAAKQEFLGNARGLIMPSTFEEPFGMVMIEALACGTPILGLDSGAIPEVITRQSGVLVPKTMVNVPGRKRPQLDEETTINSLANAIPELLVLDRSTCRKEFETRFTLQQMAQAHHDAYSEI